MKKTKLLTSLAAFALVVGLGACEEIEDALLNEDDSQLSSDEGETSESEGGDTTEEGDENEGGDTIISEDVEDALGLLDEYGADITSWSGVDYSWKLDESETASGADYYEEAYQTNILATEADGVVTGLYEDLSSMSIYGYTLYTDKEYEYYDGSTLFTLEDSALSSEEKSVALSYFTYYPYYYAEEDIEYFASFKGLTSLMGLIYGYNFEGSITELEDGNLVVYVAISSEYTEVDDDYGTIVGSFVTSLEVVYDANGGLVSIDYEVYEDDSYTDLDMGLIYIESETCSDFTGTIGTPEWAVAE